MVKLTENKNMVGAVIGAKIACPPGHATGHSNRGGSGKKE
jgi:hypothetical protein